MYDETFAHGTGNVFTDLEREGADERKTKTRLALVVSEIIAERKLKQIDAAKMLGFPQPSPPSLPSQ